MSQSLSQTKTPRGVRSFVRRAGKMSTAQRHYLRAEHPYLFRMAVNAQSDSAERQLIDLSAWITEQSHTFNRAINASPNLALDIGFGMGDSTLFLAEKFPQWLWLAVEVHPPGVARLLRLMIERGVSNIRIIEGDIAFFHRALPPAQCAFITTFFPDPWPKARHHKRRLIQPPFFEALAKLVPIGALWHIATDWTDYAQSILESASMPEVCRRWSLRHTMHNNEVGAINPEALPHPQLIRPPTKFAQKAILAERTIHTFAFIRHDLP